MEYENKFDVIIIGGSYAGLSAGMILGRSLRKTLIIDSGKPCNIITPHSHNFLTQDGKTPIEISTLARQQVEKYKTIKLLNGLAISGKEIKDGFEIETEDGNTFNSKKLIFATGVKDIIPKIKGFVECWGTSILHCPYCHGYEYRYDKTGIIANGDKAFELGKLISNWTKDLTIFSNGKCSLTVEQKEKLTKNNVKINESEIEYFNHNEGYLKSIVFKNATTQSLKALYLHPNFEQHCKIPQQLNCEITEQNFIKINPFQQTTIHGVYACGDNTSQLRSVSYAVAMGGIAGGIINRELIEESF